MNDAPTSNIADDEDKSLVAIAGTGLLFHEMVIDLDNLGAGSFRAAPNGGTTVGLNPHDDLVDTTAPAGVSSLTYTDGAGGGAFRGVSVTVDPVDGAPAPVDHSVIANTLDGPVITIPISSLLANAGQADGQVPADFSVVAGTESGGTAVVRGGHVVFTPEPGSLDIGSFSYTVSNGAHTSAPTVVTIAADSETVGTSASEPEVISFDGASLILSTAGDAVLGGLSFGDDDLVEYKSSTNSSTTLFDGGVRFSATDEDIDAVHILPNGHIILSTTDDATIGGLSFGDDDLVEFDPVTGTATLYFDGSALFSNTQEDIDAVHVLANGHIILSTTAGASLGGLSFGDDDLVEFDPVTGTATLYFDGGAWFSANEDIDAVHILDNGHILLSTTSDATLGGLTFGDDDVVEFDPVTGTATLVFDGGALFSATDEDVDAIFVTLPVANDPPSVSLANTVTSLAEDTNTSAAIKVADIQVSDDGIGTNVLSLSGADMALFEIVGTELRLKAGAALDFETNPVLDVTVQVDDATVGGTPDGSAPLVIDVPDVNEPPTVSLANTIASLSQDADTSAAIRVADIQVSDDALGTNVLSLSGADMALFEIVGTELRLKAGMLLDAATNPALDVTVAVDDAAVGATPDDVASLSIGVTTTNAPPTVSLANTVTNLAEDTNTGTAIKVADIQVNDDGVGTNDLSLSGADMALFEIVGTELRLKAGTLLDAATNPALDVTVEVDDAAVGATPDDTAPLSIGVTPVNDPPTVSLANTIASLAEDTNTSAAIKVADIQVSDDGIGTNVLSLSGADMALFEIVGTELRLKAGTLLDAATNPALDVTVEVDDAAVGATPDDTAPLSIGVTPVNDPPTISNLAGDTLTYIVPGGTAGIEQGDDALVQDPDSADFAGGQLTVAITTGGVPSEDRLSIENQGNGAGQIGFDGTNVSYGGTLIGTATGGTAGNPLIVSLNGSADAAAATALLRSVTYENTDAATPSFGPRGVDFTLSDGDGGTSATYSTTVAVSAGAPQVFEVRVFGTENDAEQKVGSGSMDLTSSDLELTFEGTGQQIVGIRFTGIEVPQGATITNAYIQFQVDETSSSASSLVIQGEATPDAQPFTSTNGNISSRSMTTSSTPWLPAAWNTVGEAGPDQQTPNISGIIQEIVSQADWASGNSLVIMVTGTGTRTAESYNGDSSAAPLLHIEYSFVDDGTPRIDLDADNSSRANANDYLATYFVDSGPIAIADVDVQITDSNDTQLASAHIQLINPELGDQLLSGAFPGGISLDPSSTPTDLILIGNASLADYATAIKGITFDNTEIGPTPGARTIEVTVNDGTNDSATATSTVTVASGSTISFWVIADTPYSSGQLSALQGYIASVPQDAEFIVHLGDIKSGSGDLTQSTADTVANALLPSPVPVFIIPGDNEFNDTPNPDASWAIWESTFTHFDQNWQHNIAVSYQAGREENFAFVSDGVLFIGINLVGGSDADAQEFADRSADDLAWIDANFAQFGNDVTSAVIFGHASPTKSAYNDFENGFVMEAQQFDKPILYLMGDKHNWSLSNPWSDAPNITRIVVEQTGSNSDSDPLLVMVSSDPDQPFTYDHDFGLIA